MKEKTADKYLKIQTVAEALSCSDDYVYILIRNGDLVAVRIGERALRISEKSLTAFLAARVVNPEDYYAPKDPPSRETEPQKPKVARSNWMDR